MSLEQEVKVSLFGAEVSDAFTVNLAVDSSKDTVGLGLGNTLGLLLWCSAVVETHTNNSFESVTEATEVGEGGGKALVIDAIIVLLLVFADGENALRLLFAIVSLFSGRTSGNVDDRHNQLRFFNDDRFDDLRFFNDDGVDDLRFFNDDRVDDLRLFNDDRVDDLRLFNDDGVDDLRLFNDDGVDNLRFFNDDRVDDLRLFNDDRVDDLRLFNDDGVDDLRFFNDDRVDDLRHFFKANLRHAIFEDFIRVNTDVVRGLSSAICLVLQSSTGNNDGDYLLRVHNDGLVDDLRRIIVARR